jgi:hypothetical protein
MECGSQHEVRAQEIDERGVSPRHQETAYIPWLAQNNAPPPHLCTLAINDD